MKTTYYFPELQLNKTTVEKILSDRQLRKILIQALIDYRLMMWGSNSTSDAPQKALHKHLNDWLKKQIENTQINQGDILKIVNNMKSITLTLVSNGNLNIAWTTRLMVLICTSKRSLKNLYYQEAFDELYTRWVLLSLKQPKKIINKSLRKQQTFAKVINEDLTNYQEKFAPDFYNNMPYEYVQLRQKNVMLYSLIFIFVFLFCSSFVNSTLNTDHTTSSKIFNQTIAAVGALLIVGLIQRYFDYFVSVPFALLQAFICPSFFDWQRLPLSFKVGLENELDELYQQLFPPKYCVIKSPKVKTKPDTRDCVTLQTSSTTPIPDNKQSTTSDSTSDHSFPTKTVSRERDERTAAYTPSLYCLTEPSTPLTRVECVVPDGKGGNKTLTWYPEIPHDQLFLLWSHAPESQAFRFCVVFFNWEALQKQPISMDILTALYKTTAYAHIVGRGNHSGFVPIAPTSTEHSNGLKSGKKGIPPVEDAKGISRQAAFKLKTFAGPAALYRAFAYPHSTTEPASPSGDRFNVYNIGIAIKTH